MKTNKRPLLSVLVAGALMVGGWQLAYAHGHGDGGHHNYMHNDRMDEEAPSKANIEGMEKFLDATTELRKKFTQKRAEMRALMHSTNPDVANAGKISGELFDLREQLTKAAKDNGLDVPVALSLVGGGMGGHHMGDGNYGDQGRGYCNQFN